MSGTLGFEVRNDIDLGFMRWLTVGIPGDEHEYLLELPNAPHYPEQEQAALRDLVTKGMAGAKFIYTDDCQKTFETLKAAGVEITEEPTERFYGIDMGARDPFGNHIRITQPVENMELPPDLQDNSPSAG